VISPESPIAWKEIKFEDSPVVITIRAQTKKQTETQFIFVGLILVTAGFGRGQAQPVHTKQRAPRVVKGTGAAVLRLLTFRTQQIEFEKLKNLVQQY
jgi:hypothetical protein